MSFERARADEQARLLGIAVGATTIGTAQPLETLAQIRLMCCEMVAASDTDKRVHQFALRVWRHIEAAHPELLPNQRRSGVD